MRTLITLAIVLFCLQLWAQVPDTTNVAPGRLIIKVNQAFQTIGTRTNGIIETEQTWFNNLAIGMKAVDPAYTAYPLFMPRISEELLPWDS